METPCCDPRGCARRPCLLGHSECWKGSQSAFSRSRYDKTEFGGGGVVSEGRKALGIAGQEALQNMLRKKPQNQAVRENDGDHHAAAMLGHAQLAAGALGVAAGG